MLMVDGGIQRQCTVTAACWWWLVVAALTDRLCNLPIEMLTFTSQHCQAAPPAGPAPGPAPHSDAS